METENLDFVQILRLDNVELLDFKEHHSTLVDRGHLEVLFNKDLDLVLLKLHKFLFALDRMLQIVASSDDEHEFRSYLLPNGADCYLLRVGVPSSNPSVTNLETVFENCCQLVRNPELETQLQSYAEKKGLFSKGGSLLKEALIKGSDIVSKTVSTVSSKMHPMNPNNMLIRKMDELKLTDRNQTVVEKLPRSQAIGIMEVSNEASKRQSTGFWNNLSEAGKEDDKVLKREDELQELSKVPNVSGEEKGRLEKLSEKGHDLVSKAKEGLHSITSKITGTLGSKQEGQEGVSEQEKEKSSVVDKASREHEKVSGQINEKIEEVGRQVLPAEGLPEKKDLREDKSQTEAENKGHTILGSVREQVHNISTKISEKVGEIKERYMPEGDKSLQSTEGSEIEPSGGVQKESVSLKEKVSGGIHSLSERISQGVDNVKNRYRSTKDKPEEGENQEGTGEFREVKEGFYTEVQDLDKEQREEIRKEMHKNPFDALADENINIAQPLAHSDVVGGNISDIAEEGHQNIDVNRLEQSLGGGASEDKSLVEKIKQGVDNISSKISDKISDTKEKIKSIIPGAKGSENQAEGQQTGDKENAPQTA